MRRTSDPLTPSSHLRRLQERPFDYDFLQAMRRIECLQAAKPRFGLALRPADEPIRLGQTPSMAFAPATLSSVSFGRAGRPPRLEQFFFGMLGPNGALPLHLTEYAHYRLLHHDDSTFARFLDVFHHRFLELFYRAWAQARPTANLDRPRDDRFAAYVGSLIGIGTPALSARDALGDHAKLFHSGLLVRQVRNADGLRDWLQSYFRLPVEIRQFVAHWLRLPVEDRTCLGVDTQGARLGVGTVLGSAVWDRQHKFRIVLGPMSLAHYESFLPGGTALPRLVALVRQYLCFELVWDAKLVLMQQEVPRTVLGRYGRLGWTTWLGNYLRQNHAGDLTLDAEHVLARSGPNAAGQQPESADVAVAVTMKVAPATQEPPLARSLGRGRG